ncbi:MAG: histidine--tRNA ligase [Armatimonadetes bacterium]|nr:histidine--tRNA ligase [Armatimonadota bacterium]
MKKKIVKPASISGFPEFTPGVQMVAVQQLDRIRKIFELHGFVPVETPVVERLEVLLAKGGDADKEMYVLQRLHAEDDSEASLGLHYDLTVPFARYVAQHFNELVFPFRRYQMQYCWRGERPQEGRFRQFFQCDVDVVAVDQLELSFDAEIPLVVYEALRALEIGDFDLRISNRKILQGYLEGLGVEKVQEVTRILDKLDKIGRDNVLRALAEQGLSQELGEKSLQIGAISTRDSSFVERVLGLGVRSSLLQQGLEELAAVLDTLNRSVGGGCLADLSVTRGFDYYTGTVYEARWREFPEVGSIAAGGRYDDLASSYTNTRVPGVGMSVGFSRIFAKLAAENRLPEHLPRCPTRVLVAWLDPAGPERAREIARQLRSRGVNTEVYHRPGKIVKQLKYADRKGIPFVLFDTDAQVKDLRSGEQYAVDLERWMP